MRALKRLKSKFDGSKLPDNVTENIARCFEEQFSELYPYSMDGRYFDVFGQLFADELLLIVSLLSQHNTSMPITLFISKDVEASLIEKPAVAKKIWDDMSDLAGIFFDEVLSTKEWNNYQSHWQSHEHKKNTFFLKSSRENIELTLNANQLLGDETEDDDDMLH